MVDCKAFIAQHGEQIAGAMGEGWTVRATKHSVSAEHPDGNPECIFDTECHWHLVAQPIHSGRKVKGIGWQVVIRIHQDCDLTYDEAMWLSMLCRQFEDAIHEASENLNSDLVRYVEEDTES